jgi:hypothetical protein
MPTADHGKGQHGFPQQIEAKDNTMLTAASQVALDLQIFNI